MIDKQGGKMLLILVAGVLVLIGGPLLIAMGITMLDWLIRR